MDHSQVTEARTPEQIRLSKKAYRKRKVESKKKRVKSEKLKRKKERRLKIKELEARKAGDQEDGERDDADDKKMVGAAEQSNVKAKSDGKSGGKKKKKRKRSADAVEKAADVVGDSGGTQDVESGVCNDDDEVNQAVKDAQASGKKRQKLRKVLKRTGCAPRRVSAVPMNDSSEEEGDATDSDGDPLENEINEKPNRRKQPDQSDVDSTDEDDISASETDEETTS